MPTFEYIETVAYTAESNETLIGKKTIRVLDCSTNINAVDDCDLFNSNMCANDSKYFNPFVLGDKIYYQFYFLDRLSSYFFAYLIDLETGLELPGLTIESGNDLNLVDYRTIIIDTSVFPNTTCFQLKVVQFSVINFTEEELEEFEICVSDLMMAGKTEQQAELICLLNSYEDKATVVSFEPYKKVICQNTIVVEGIYPGRDCDGHYYGDFYDAEGIAIPNSNSFKLQFRIFAEVNPNQYDIEQVRVNKRRKSAKRLLTFNFLTKKLPFYVVEKIANAFNAEKILIDDVEYLEALSFNKNNEQGSMWIIQTTLVQECDTINFSCNT